MSLPNAFVTLLTTSSYLPGALVLLHSLLDLHPEPRQFKIVCLVTPETVDARTIGELRKAGFDLVIGVEPIASGLSGKDGLDLMGRPDLNLALTKLHLFRLSSLLSTLIYLDADVLPLRPLSHLFTITSPHILSACPDTGWPDCFNSGVMVIRPRESDWTGLRELLKNGEGSEGIYSAGNGNGNGSFDGADQGLLNEWFSEEGGGGDWNRLSFTYNVTPTAAYTYAPAYRRYGSKINAVHFIGSNKPWSNLANRPAGMSLPKGKEQPYDYPALIDRWYQVYDKHIRRTAAHAPDIAQRFAVPELSAVWNQLRNAGGVPAQPEDRLDLEQLKLAAQTGVTSLRSGQYVSLPLDGRIDLLMPRPSKLSPPRSPSPVDSPALAGHGQTTPPDTWDAQRSAPPSSGRPEMENPLNAHYHPAWDASPAQQSAYFSGRESESEEQYPILPASVTNDAWYKQFTGTTPDRNNIQPVFPWEEEGGQQHTPSRVFPRGSTPPHLRQRGRHSAHPSIAVQSATPPGQPSTYALPSPPPQSMSQAMATYKNAWDKVPEIQRYVSRITGTSSSNPRDLTAMGLATVPGTPAVERGNPHQREQSADRRSDVSGDGDDEDEGDDEEGEAEFDNSPIGFARMGEFQPQLSLPSAKRYRDRQAQADRPGGATLDPQVQPNDSRDPSPSPNATDQTRPKPAAVQAVRDRPKPSRISSSSDTATPRNTHTTNTSSIQLVTPPSDSPGISPSRVPSLPTRQSYETSTSTPPLPVHVAGRAWDPSTSLDTRKRETQEVLGRLMRAGGFGREQAGQRVSGQQQTSVTGQQGSAGGQGEVKR